MGQRGRSSLDEARAVTQPAAAGVDVPALFFSALGVLSALVLPFVRFRPNRIADGSLQYLAQADPAAAVILVLVWLVGVVAAIVPFAGRARIGAVVAVVAAVTAILAAGSIAHRLAGGEPIARVSPSSGFWVTALAGYAAFLAASRRSGPRHPLFRPILAASVPLALVALLASGYLDSLSIMREFAVQKAVFYAESATHAALAGSAVLLGCVLGIPLGVLALRRAAFKRATFFVLNTVQTIPSLALFGILIIPLAALSRRFPLLQAWGISGIGRAPALLALSFYAMLPVARNTFTALDQIPQPLREAGAGMGMNRRQLLTRIEIPLAIPVILAGARTSAVQAVGNTVVTALIGAGGLGIFIFQGLGQYASDMILLGTLPVIGMAVATDVLMALLVRVLTPVPMRGPLA
jgi:osmoprotectant transport system permease protein